MKNHIISLQSQLEHREWQKLEGYLNRMAEAGSLIAGGHASGNNAVEALLYQKQKTAMELQIRWDSDVQLPKNCPVEEFDLCVLFGNLLDNAINACRQFQGGGDPFIHIQAKMVEQYLLLETKNSADSKNTEPVISGSPGHTRQPKGHVSDF